MKISWKLFESWITALRGNLRVYKNFPLEGSLTELKRNVIESTFKVNDLRLATRFESQEKENIRRGFFNNRKLDKLRFSSIKKLLKLLRNFHRRDLKLIAHLRTFEKTCIKSFKKLSQPWKAFKAFVPHWNTLLALFAQKLSSSTNKAFSLMMTADDDSWWSWHWSQLKSRI